MTREKLLEKAIQIATIAHQKQVDKAGKPYIEHSLRVMNNLKTIEEKIVGVLHDVVEDSDFTLLQLKELGFPEEIIHSIDAITKRPQEDYQAYLQRVISNPVAVKVKIADMKDNMNLNRISNPTEKDYQRLKKYQANLPKLLESINKKSNQN